ncbi:MAG: HAD family hydrolase [Candidatus Hydrothermarchaeaceae archaeon]
MIKIISFDADGTLVDRHFMDYFWNIGIPEIYAKKNNISPEKAEEKIFRMYHEVGENDIRWYTPSYWFSKLGIDETLEETLRMFRHEMRIYPEVNSVLEKLSKKYELIVISNAPREILEFELSYLDEYFSRVFSSTSDYRKVRKTSDVYLNVTDELDIRPEEMIHVGDHWNFDYLAPRKAGIKTFFVDRSGKKTGKDIVKDLREFESRVALSRTC